MIHSFDADLAKLVGINAALVYYHLEFWCKRNEQTGSNVVDGEAWTYCSLSDLVSTYPYLTKNQVRYALKVLLDTNLIKRRKDLNKISYDRTYWYCVCDVSHADVSSITRRCVNNHTPMCDVSHTDVLPITQPSVNGHTPSVNSHTDSVNGHTTIPIYITDNIKQIPNGNKYVGDKTRSKKFTPPTLEELQAYCLEKGIELDCEYFLDYYNSNGWVVGKNKMRDWKATARNWARRNNDKPRAKTQPVNEFEALKEELAKGGSLF